MPSDYPDYTTAMQVIGSNIMIPMDIQGAYIMMPVDIQAQWVDLDVQITAENIKTIMLALTAETMGNIFVDIKSQTIADLKINIDAQNVGVYLQPDWQTKEGTDKNEEGHGAVAQETFVWLLDYEVPLLPTPKTFYICQWGFYCDTDYGVRAILASKRNETETYLSFSGGRTGNAQSFTKPIAVIAGDHIIGGVECYEPGGTGGGVSVGGYEI